MSIESAAPLTPPNGRQTPSKALPASRVGLPSRSSARPSAIGSPCNAASRILPRAMTVMAMSRT
jgi:hypothetical protein